MNTLNAVLIVIVLIMVVTLATSQRHTLFIRARKYHLVDDNIDQMQLNDSNRPGSAYDIIYADDAEVTMEPPVWVVTMLYTKESEVHPLFPVFMYVARDMNNDDAAPESRIGFVAQMVDGNPNEHYPKITKTHRDGSVSEYTGYADYGQLYDWCKV